MANTHRGWAMVPLYVGSGLRFDNIASMIQAGSALGAAYDVNASGLVASVPFPRAASLHQAVGASPGAPLYVWDSMIFRSSATTLMWLTDPNGTANASIGIPMFGNDPKPIAFPCPPDFFSAYAVGAGQLNMIFVQGDDLSL